MSLNPDQFHMVTNMKDKPNAQGTLFQGGTGLRTPESRQPRGYSPERLGEVQKNTWTIPSVTYSADVGLPTARKYTRQLHETLARSTAPVEDMKRVQWRVDQVPGGRDSGRPGTGGGLSDNAEGDFHAHADAGLEFRSKSADGRRPVTDPQSVVGNINIKRGAEKTRTPLHELGHAMSAAQGLHPRGSLDPWVRGGEEGRAEQYADTHARKPGYRREPDTKPDQPANWHQSYGLTDEDSQHEFDSGFHEERHRQRYQAGARGRRRSNQLALFPQDEGPPPVRW